RRHHCALGLHEHPESNAPGEDATQGGGTHVGVSSAFPPLRGISRPRASEPPRVSRVVHAVVALSRSSPVIRGSRTVGWTQRHLTAFTHGWKSWQSRHLSVQRTSLRVAIGAFARDETNGGKTHSRQRCAGSGRGRSAHRAWHSTRID